MASKRALATLKVALVGTKFMGRAHANAWGQVGRFFDVKRKVAVDCVAARDAQALKAFAEQWGIPRWTDDWRTLANDERIDLVDVLTSNDSHREIALAMLAAGKHVACEKPLAGTLDEARAMRDAAQKSKRETFVWFNYRRCPAVALAHQLVREGRLGRIRHVRATYLQSWGGPKTPFSWRFSRASAGSGAHGDLNAHIVDMARFITGDEITEIHGAVARTFVEERLDSRTKRKVKSDVDDAVVFLASFAHGAVASFEASRVATGHHNRNAIEINGEKGSLRFEFEDMNVLWFFDAALDDRTSGWRRILATSSSGAHPFVDAWWPDGHVLGYEHTFTNQAADIVRALSGEKPLVPLPDFADAYETQRVLEAALIAAKERTSVRLSEVR
ncbi:MAG: Gfo/Idh/MocA family oxidoreductase [Planctomycetota bacterium]|nr:Gfo/Idh/MocA family oxidoreductase [Planctomycetota bacterium]